MNNWRFSSVTQRTSGPVGPNRLCYSTHLCQKYPREQGNALNLLCLYSLRLSLSQHTHLLQSPYLWFFVLFCLFIRKQSQTSNYELWNIFIFLTVTIKFSLKCMLFYVICFHTMFLCKSAYDYNLLPLVRCSLRTHCIITQCPMHGVFFFFFLFKSKFYSDSEAGRKIINLVKNHIPS